MAATVLPPGRRMSKRERLPLRILNRGPDYFRQYLHRSKNDPAGRTLLQKKSAVEQLAKSRAPLVRKDQEDISEDEEPEKNAENDHELSLENFENGVQRFEFIRKKPIRINIVKCRDFLQSTLKKQPQLQELRTTPRPPQSKKSSDAISAPPPSRNHDRTNPGTSSSSRAILFSETPSRTIQNNPSIVHTTCVATPTTMMTSSPKTTFRNNPESRSLHSNGMSPEVLAPPRPPTPDKISRLFQNVDTKSDPPQVPRPRGFSPRRHAYDDGLTHFRPIQPEVPNISPPNMDPPCWTVPAFLVPPAPPKRSGRKWAPVRRHTELGFDIRPAAGNSSSEPKPKPLSSVEDAIRKFNHLDRLATDVVVSSAPSSGVRGNNKLHPPESDSMSNSREDSGSPPTVRAEVKVRVTPPHPPLPPAPGRLLEHLKQNGIFYGITAAHPPVLRKAGRNLSEFVIIPDGAGTRTTAPPPPRPPVPPIEGPTDKIPPPHDMQKPSLRLSSHTVAFKDIAQISSPPWPCPAPTRGATRPHSANTPEPPNPRLTARFMYRPNRVASSYAPLDKAPTGQHRPPLPPPPPVGKRVGFNFPPSPMNPHGRLSPPSQHHRGGREGEGGVNLKRARSDVSGLISKHRTATLDAFFEQMGTDPEIFQTIAANLTSPVNHDDDDIGSIQSSVSVRSSPYWSDDDDTPPDERTNRNRAAVGGGGGGGTGAINEMDVSHLQRIISPIERNARIIKWLYTCQIARLKAQLAQNKTE